MPQNHVLFKGKLQLQWSLWGIEDFFFFSPSLSFFSPQLNLRRESLLLSEEYFSTFFYCGRKSFFLFGHHCSVSFFPSVFQRFPA